MLFVSKYFIFLQRHIQTKEAMCLVNQRAFFMPKNDRAVQNPRVISVIDFTTSLGCVCQRERLNRFLFSAQT